MGATKTGFFSENQNEVALLLKALSHPARIAIIEYLLSEDTCICTDIVNELPLAQATISQHLKELKNAKIIKGTIEGKSICYCIDEVVWNKIQDYFQKVAQTIKQKNEICC